MRITALLPLLTSLLISLNLNAQQLEECDTDRKHRMLLQNDPEYAQRVQENELKIQSFLKNQNPTKSAGVIQIPLVVHVIHTGQAVGVGANISMTQINSAIDTLNARYRNLQGSSVDTEIEFVLAQRDPNGNATNGVVRVDGSSVPLYATEGIGDGTTGADELAVKSLSRWPNTQYYNVWVVTEIEDNNGGFGIQGYAYFPGAGPDRDGTVIMNTCFGTNGTVNPWNNRNRTFVHELGHGLNLYHTFEGDNNGSQCPSAGNLCGSGVGDCVGDTDPHIRAGSNCPTGTNSCTGGSIDGVTSNFMNYSSQTCAINYTSGQSTRMRAALQTLRPSLITSLGGVAPTTSSVVAASCTPTTTTSNSFGIGITSLSLNNVTVVSSTYAQEGAYIDQTQHQLINLVEGTSDSIKIETGGVNNEDVAVFIDFNNNGNLADAGELVFSSLNADTHNGVISIPSAGVTTNTPLRMRVISDWFNNTISGPCYNPAFGQTEDYAVLISPGSTPLSLSINSTNISCFGANDGTAQVVATGGDTPYTYLWSNAQSTASINNLSSGIYRVTVTDNSGTSDTISTLIQEPAEFKSQILLAKNISTVGASDGELVAWSRGGTAPISYAWDDPANQTTRKATGLAAGTYTVTLTDANSCTDITSLSIGLGACPADITPTNLTARYLSSTSALLDWDQVVGTNVYYLIRYKESGQANWQTLFTTAEDSLQISGLSPNTAYLYIVRTHCNGSWSGQAFSHFRTLSNDCVNPTGVGEQWVLGTQTKLVWNFAANTSQYEIRYRDTTATNWNNFFVNGSFNYYWLTGLSNHTSYEWQIRSSCRFDPASAQQWSVSRSFTTGGSALPSQSARIKTSTDPKFEEVSIFPNPSNGQVTVLFEETDQFQKITVFDLSGREVANFGTEGTSTQFDLSHLENGTYLIQLKGINSLVNERIIIQK